MNPLSRVTMYDALTMLTSGFLLCIMVFPIRYCCCDSHWSRGILFWVICYAVGLVYHRILDGLAFEGWDYLRDNEFLIRKMHRKIRKKFDGNVKKPSTLEGYYDAYYCLMKSRKLGSIPILEVQVAFIRDIVPILIVYAIGVYFFEFGIWKDMDHWLFTRCEIEIFLVLAILLLVVIRFVSQYKIYELVWEGDYFIQQCDNTANGNNNNGADVNSK